MKPTFFKVELTPIEGKGVDVLDYAYKRFPTSQRTLNAIHEGEITLDDRIGEGVCPDCGGTEWMILSIKQAAVREGGKPYIECLGCGHTTHL